MTIDVHSNGKWSRWGVAFIVVAVLGYRVHSLVPNELAWDVFGYYLYLPATFIHHDPLLTDIGWVHQVMNERPISGTLYQITDTPQGGPMYFFLLGMSLLYLPFFLLGHVIAWMSGQPMDGFSAPYQYTIAIGFVCYTAIGLVHLRRILLHFFDDRPAAWLLIVVTIGTNWFHFATTKNLETASALFMLMAVLVWNTICWHRNGARKHVLWMAATMAVISLVKPSEVLALLIPLLWGVHDRASLKERGAFLWRHRGQLLAAVVLGLMILSPQLIYWKITTDHFIYDSYKNPGIGLDLCSPHVMDAFFSYRKGWLVYTPIMVFALVGLIHLHRSQRALFPVIVLWFVASTWIVMSWTEWWYGASYGLRPMITSYVLLALPLGYFMRSLDARSALIRYGTYGSMSVLVVFNLFQMWQHHHNILDPYRTTKSYYWAIFGKTTVPEGAERLKSIERSFSTDQVFGDPQNYHRVVVGRMDFEADLDANGERQLVDSADGGRVFRLDGDVPYTTAITSTYGEWTNADHAWVHASMRLKIPSGHEGEMPCLVFSMQRKEGSYAYRSMCVDPSTFPRDEWRTVAFDQLLPPIRDPNDELRCYAWCRSSATVFVDDVQLEISVPKPDR